MKDASFTWNKGDACVLKNLNIKVKKGHIVMVVGSVGSGKSSLLQSALGETVLESGEVKLTGSVAYVAQESWIVNATARDNILFGKPFDAKLYQQVIQATALIPDFELMPSGDLTEIGDKGINLSGGQRQRVALARVRHS